MYIFASDIDGTLVFNDQISQEDLEAIAKFQQAGNKFGLCTGRFLKGAIDIYPGLHPDFIVAATGACILDQNQNIIFERSIPYEIGKEIFETYKEKDWIIIQSGNREKLYVTKKVLKTPFEQVVVEDYSSLKMETIHGFGVIVKSEEIAKDIAREVSEKYPMLDPFVNRASIDIVPKGCSKGIGTLFVQDYYKEGTLAGIGDSYNDLPMLEAVEKSFTFVDSPQEIQNQVKYIVHSVKEAIDLLEAER